MSRTEAHLTSTPLGEGRWIATRERHLCRVVYPKPLSRADSPGITRQHAPMCARTNGSAAPPVTPR